MRAQRRFSINARTGQILVQHALLPEASSVSERFRSLRPAAAELLDGPVEQVAMWMRCDGCSATAPVNSETPELPAGWKTTPEGDFCRLCVNSGHGAGARAEQRAEAP